VANVIRGFLIVCVVLLVGVMPIAWYRAVYTHGKRLRVVDSARHFYRSGEMTAEGFVDAFERLGIRTVVNVQDDFPDPLLNLTFLNRNTILESELCARHGVRYVALAPDLISKRRVGAEHPAVIDQFLSVLDDERNYPVLIHCKAGLHRTGILCAVYRMEYQGWSVDEAYTELKAHGFGDWVCTSANDYVEQYVLAYRRRPVGVAAANK
jgi:tyrosine-protein phosphatase SIW14